LEFAVTGTSDVVKKIEELCEPAVFALGLELVQLQYRREADGWVVRLLVDRAGGVTVEECGELSRQVSNVLDVEDPILHRYRLEVSSPGLDRPLCKREHFSRFVGEVISLHTHEPFDGRKNFQGVLRGFANDWLLIEVDQIIYELPYEAVEKANLVPVIDSIPSHK
jgi:ribosome maturation factor RimP